MTLALQGQNVQVASGVLNQPPVPNQASFQVAVRTLGRLSDPGEFGNIVVKQTTDAVVRIKDVARVELAAQDYTSASYLNRDPVGGASRCSSGRARTRSRPARISARPWRISRSRFPAGLQHAIIYDPTQFIQQSVDAVIETIVEAVDPRRAGRHPVPADLARGDHPDRGDSRFR